MRTDGCFTTEELAEYSVGRGNWAWRQRVEEHLTGCLSCSSELAAFGRVDDLLKQATTRKAPDLWYAIEPRLTPRRRSWLQSTFAVPAKIYAGAATAVVVVLAAVLLLLNPVRQQSPQSSAVKLEQVDSHVTMTWSDPFADRVSLAVIDSESAKRERTQ
jgi:anti-sigma factor RsiW